MVRIYIQPLQIGRIQFEVTTMFYSAVIMLIGFHMLQFAVYTKMFAKRIGQLPGSFGMADRICAFFGQKGIRDFPPCAFMRGGRRCVYTLPVEGKRFWQVKYYLDMQDCDTVWFFIFSGDRGGVVYRVYENFAYGEDIS